MYPVCKTFFLRDKTFECEMMCSAMFGADLASPSGLWSLDRMRKYTWMQPSVSGKFVQSIFTIQWHFLYFIFYLPAYYCFKKSYNFAGKIMQFEKYRVNFWNWLFSKCRFFCNSLFDLNSSQFFSLSLNTSTSLPY